MRTIRLAVSLGAALLAAALAGCQQAPVTGRSQLILLPDDEAAKMGADAYKQILKEGKVSKDPDLNRRVRAVGKRIAEVADDPGYEWEFKVLEDKEPNAFALPGGKVGVNSGLFKVAKNDDQLAAVMAHEVAHAIARHSAERMSRQMMVQTGLGVAGAVSETAAANVGLMAQAATLGLILPFTRDQESEADEIGLLYMAKAGYDPREAVKLWQNFEDYGGGRPPEFLSTHPSPGTRIDRLNALMPNAMQVYKANKGKYG
ncbi:MAG: M48 family metallopeptidase [Rhodospirillales bacterium]|nr:M48 family metallopeptidase [Rhodospirillales bacterium]